MLSLVVSTKHRRSCNTLMGVICLVLVSATSTFSQNTFARRGADQSTSARLSAFTNATHFIANNSPGALIAEPHLTPTATLADPTISIGDVTVNEGDPGVFSLAQFRISLSAASDKTVSVTATTQSGTATGNTDFVAGSLVLDFAPGQTSQLLTVFVVGDTDVEGTEQFFLNLSSPVNATIADGQGVGTIIDDDTLILLTEEGTAQRGAAVDSVIMTRDVFPIVNDLNFSSDHRTRITLFAIGLKLMPGDIVTATAEDSLGAIRPLEVESARLVPNYDWLYQVVLKLNDQITVAGDVKIKITHGATTSNTVLVGVKPQ